MFTPELDIDITTRAVLRAIAVIKHCFIFVEVIESGSETKDSGLPEHLGTGRVTPVSVQQQVPRGASKDCVLKEGFAISIAIKIELAVDERESDLIRFGNVVDSLALEVDQVEDGWIVGEVISVVQGPHQISHVTLPDGEKIRPTLVCEWPINDAGKTAQRCSDATSGFDAIAVTSSDIKSRGTAVPIFDGKRPTEQRNSANSVSIDYRYRTGIKIATLNRMDKIFCQHSVYIEANSVKSCPANRELAAIVVCVCGPG